MKKILFFILWIIPGLWLNAQTDIVKKGDRLPSFELQSLANGTMTSGILQGKVVLITIFATWCPPCQQELGALQAAIDTREIPLDNPDLAVLVVGREHREKELEDYKEKKGFTFSIYPDPMREFTSKFATQNIPRTYLVDREGIIVYTSVGYKESEFDELIKTINKVLKEK